MNSRVSFQVPQQTFPTDVTSPSPTQLPGEGRSDDPNSILPGKHPNADRPNEREVGEDERAALPNWDPHQFVL